MLEVFVSKVAMMYIKMRGKYFLNLNNVQLELEQDSGKGLNLEDNSSLHMVDRFSISLQVERWTVETYGPTLPGFVIFATLPRLQLRFNDMVVRLLVPQCGGWKAAT